MRIPSFLGSTAPLVSCDMPGQLLNQQVDLRISELMQDIATRQLNQSLERDRRLLDILG